MDKGDVKKLLLFVLDKYKYEKIILGLCVHINNLHATKEINIDEYILLRHIFKKNFPYVRYGYQWRENFFPKHPRIKFLKKLIKKYS